MLIASVVLGLVVGVSLGLTGGGGSILAMPLLIYGLGMAPHEAVGVSLAAVGTTALLGAGLRWWHGDLDWMAGGIFAATGMVGAPVGIRLGDYLPETALLLGLAAVMGLVAARMWSRSADSAGAEAEALAGAGAEVGNDPSCRFDARGRLRITSRCGLLLAALGLGTGVLSGLFGIGGGFVIVPALVWFVGMPIARAVATSLLVMALISAVGVGSHLLAGRPLELGLTALFIVGGLGGVAVGTRLVRHLPAPLVQKIFAGLVLGLAGFIVSERLLFS